MKPVILPLRRSLHRGVTLIEALVALMVMTFGMVALMTLMGNLRLNADVAKQRGEALRLAQADLATVRGFSTVGVLGTQTAAFDYMNDLANVSATSILQDSNTSYSVSRNVTPLTTGLGIEAKSVSVTVSWRDRASLATQPLQTLVLNTLVAGVEPAFAGALSIAPPAGGVRRPLDRHPAIPAIATDLGNKTSAFRPNTLGRRVWIFNNITGVITKTCTLDVGSALTTSNLNDASCTVELGFLLSGTINFSNTDPANPGVPEATALPLDLTIAGGTFTAPRRDPQTGLLVRDGQGATYLDTVPAIPPSFECFDDSSSTASEQRFVNYNCVVFPNVIPGTTSALRPSWSGSLQLTGLSLGTLASQYRVCRYSADYSGNGNGYANADGDVDNYEHPAVYAQVTGSLPRQNFLVVKGNVSCPTAPAVDLSNGVFADYSTVQLQP